MQGLTVAWEVVACEETIIATITTLSDEPLVEVPSRHTLVVDVCGDDSTHDSIVSMNSDDIPLGKYAKH